MDDTDLIPAWHRRPWAGWLLRAGGLLLVIAAWRAGTTLDWREHVAPTDTADYGLALLAFLGASVGLAVTLLGAHLFDRVPIASRWGQAPMLESEEARDGENAGAVTLSYSRSADSRFPDRSRSAMA